MSFNPRTHTGCDTVKVILVRIALNVSIHAPTRGATHGNEVACKICYVSIHAPTRGATSMPKMQPRTTRFQSTHPHGVRLK